MNSTDDCTHTHYDIFHSITCKADYIGMCNLKYELSCHVIKNGCSLANLLQFVSAICSCFLYAGLVCLVNLLRLVSAICSCLLYAGLVQLAAIAWAFLSFSCILYDGSVRLVAIDAAFLSFSCALISGGLVCLVNLHWLVSAFWSNILYAGLVHLLSINLAFHLRRLIRYVIFFQTSKI